MQTRFVDGNVARARECDESGARVDECAQCARHYRAQHLRVLIQATNTMRRATKRTLFKMRRDRRIAMSALRGATERGGLSRNPDARLRELGGRLRLCV
jgi:hypothetical protein